MLAPNWFWVKAERGILGVASRATPRPLSPPRYPARRLAAGGHVVYATMRNLDTAADLAQYSTPQDDTLGRTDQDIMLQRIWQSVLGVRQVREIPLRIK